tara:strand:+ start:13999 stop:20073 length:6075 start_codon:yes stop_codon:yes gene_type:complete
MPSPTDFNLSPYYDDFNETKKFHRVLFRPAFAVQGRELTQSQSILQNQIERLSDHVFEQGAMVIPGDIGYDLNYYAVKLTSFTDSASVGVTLNDFIGLTLTGASSGVKARVVNVVATDGTDPNTLFVKYLNSGTNNTTTAFSAETISVTTTLQSTSTTVSAVVSATATGSAASVKEGVYYINGYHVKVNNQDLILDKYENTPSYRIGLTVAESFVTQNDDSTLNDNAQGVSNTNAPGAHRFKIDLTLTKKSLAATDDANFVELLRLKNGIVQNQVRTTEYAVLEDTLARRTFDESGDYAVKDFDIDLREHLISGTNRGIYSSSDGGLESKIAAGMESGKAYVQGYEIETLGTTFVDVNKARSFDTQNNSTTRFDVGNFVNVNNVYGSPDIGFVSSGPVAAFKEVNLYREETAVRGTENAGSGSNIKSVGHAKSKGFQYTSGNAVSGNYASSSATSNVFRHYLFDVVMFTHINVAKNQAFTNGEEITGGTSGAKGTVDQLSTSNQYSITGATAANPVVITATNTLQDGQQVTINSVGGMTELNGNTYTVKNPTSSNFELDVDSSSFTTYTSGGTADQSVVVLYNVSGTFVPGETITGGISSNTAVIQADARGFKGVTTYDFSSTKQIGMPGSPTYTADTILDSTNGESLQITGTLSVENSGSVVTGFGTKFNTELRLGDSITFTTDAGSSITRIVEAIISDTSLELSAAVGGSDVSTKSNATRNRSTLKDTNKNISVFKLPYETVKTLKTASNSGASDTNLKVRRQFVKTLTGNGDETISAGTDETFASLLDSDFSVSIMSTGSGGSGAVGDFLSLQGNNHEGNPIFTLSGSPTGKSLVLDFGTNYAGHKIKILATVSRAVVEEKSKTLVTGFTRNHTSLADIKKQGGMRLSRCDIYKLNSVKMATAFGTYSSSGEIDITDRFTLDNGQRDNFYDIGRVHLKKGAVDPTGSIQVNVDYFSHGSGDVFTVDSYSGVVDYEDIPSHTSDTTGETFDLRDCLDFRPRVDDNSTINKGEVDRYYNGAGASTVDVVKFGTDITSDLEYYMPRIDKVFVDKDGKFKISEGSSALIPQSPKNLDGAMHLYTLDIPAYTLDTADITITKVDNKRYTMRDIGRLENRIENIEYYTQLSLLEMQAQNLQVQDAQGFDRFKNGFIVDNFTGHSIGDVRNLDYKVSMDMARGEVRPMFNEDAVQLIESDNDGTTITSADRTDAKYAKTGDLITLPYSEATLIDQPFASKFVNVNPFDIFSWTGSIALTPPSDEWKETERAPELVVNRTGGFDTLVQNLGNPNLTNVEIGTVWNEWQEHWSGTPTVTSSRVLGTHRQGRRIVRRTQETLSGQMSNTRTGIRTRIVPQVVRNSIGDRVVSVGIVPFLRSRTLTFNATRMKPETRVYPFFDNIDISSYITPEGGSLGGNLVTDINGAVSGTFAIPDSKNNSNPRWRTGTRVFRLTSSSTNVLSSAVQTSGEADYLAKGALETIQETIISTREPLTLRESTVESVSLGNRTSTRNVDTTIGWTDPLAQTFMIDDVGGVFLTSMDLFFSSKDDNIPVTVQIREVVNGYPGKRIVPFSEKTLNPNAVSTSTDATTATTFTFDSPVYLQEKTEYCFVVMSNCNAYNCYVGRLGEKVIGSDRTISQQPYAGVMFKSQNGSTWTAEQNEDIKFKIKRAEFENVTGTVTLCNDDLPTRTLKNNAIRTTDTSGVIRVSHPNHGMHGTGNSVTIAGISSGTYNGIAHTAINGTFTSISNVTLDSYDITTTGTANATGDIGGDVITATQNRLYDVLNLNLQTVSVPGTNISYDMRPTTGRSVHGSETEFSLTPATSPVATISNDNIYFTAPQMVASTINETNKIAGSKSLFVNLTFTTTNTKLSPVLDMQRVSAYVVQNRINKATTGNTPGYVSDIESSGTSSAAAYITKPVVLENLSTALDVRLTQNVRATSNVKLYFRLSSSEESRNISDIGWTPFNTDGEEDITVTPAENDETYNEYKYSASGLTEFNTFQIKIVMEGTNSAYPPVIRDLRGIALAV